MWGITAIVLLLSDGFISIHGVYHGCSFWRASEEKESEVCCDTCHSGNRLVLKCGLDPAKLCTPCKTGTFTDNPGRSTCIQCTKCIGLQKQVKPCTSSSDTVCDCTDGYHCGDIKCSFCRKACGKGEEPSNDRTCKPCPDGTFNDRNDHRCIPWRSCNASDQQIVVKGTTVSDIVCQPVSEMDKGWMAVAIVISLCSVMLFMVSACVIAAQKRREIIMKPVPEISPTGKSISVQEQGDCIVCYPQQEQGSHLGSVSSLESQEKLLPV